MFQVKFLEQYCKGCGFCVAFCPRKIIALAAHTNDQGYNPATVTDAARCNGCGICALMCPHVVIEVLEGGAA
ncbi:MAG: 4Fe-4S binding protein [Syntrophomonadaceae bacterium]|nr:4Fe-4S binding protein [Syntrophomonadaceae bacterium]MDH7497452.1 4Fe-4S binding protein [Syntrophomonadaceae bacterium]